MIITRPMLHFSPDQGGGGSGTSPKDAGPEGKITPGAAPGEDGKDQQDKAGGDSKLMDPDLPSDPEQLKALLKKEREDKAHLQTVHTEMKTKAEAREAEGAKAREEDLKKQGQYQKLLEEQTPKFEVLQAQTKRQEAALSGYLEAELKGVPESMKLLIPEGDAVSKLEWITKAKAAGAFGDKKAAGGKGPDGSPPPGKGGTVMTLDAFNKMTAKDRAAFMAGGGSITD